jgi:FKBP-type peptidyl-prolyl cis-trans isomerase FklB
LKQKNDNMPNYFLRFTSILSVVLLTATYSFAQKIKMVTEKDSFSYAAGMNIAMNMKNQGVSDINAIFLLAGLDDMMNGRKTQMTESMANQLIQTAAQAYMAKKMAAEKEKENAFFEENKKRSGVIALPNGIQYEILRSGNGGGPKPRPQDTVVVHYKGTLTNGSEFDNSISRGEPATFPLNRVIRGWTEILQLMSRGDNWKVYIPSTLGYGERGAGASIPPNSTLIFEIDLIDIKPAVE